MSSHIILEHFQAQKAEKLPPELELWAKEAANGDTTAQFNLGLAYYRHLVNKNQNLYDLFSAFCIIAPC